MNKFFKSVKILTIAKTLANEFDYCPSYEECSDSYKDILYFPVTEEEIKESCECHQGRRSDEITGDYDRLFLSNN